MSSHLRINQIGLRSLAGRGAALGACGLLAAACGSAMAPASSGGSAGSPGPAPSPSGTQGPGSSGSAAPGTPANVNITVGFAGSNARHWTLRCDPPSGNVPDPQSACHQLLAHQSIFAPQARHVMCPQIMSDGPAFFVSGTFLGQHVHKEFQPGGCDLTKWSVLRNIFE